MSIRAEAAAKGSKEQRDNTEPYPAAKQAIQPAGLATEQAPLPAKKKPGEKRGWEGGNLSKGGARQVGRRAGALKIRTLTLFHVLLQA